MHEKKASRKYIQKNMTTYLYFCQAFLNSFQKKKKNTPSTTKKHAYTHCNTVFEKNSDKILHFQMLTLLATTILKVP